MTGPLSRALDALLPDRAPDPLQLRALSDLEPQTRPEALAAWEALPPSVRSEILRLCGELADTNIELNFHWLARHALGDPEAEVRRRAIANLWECDDADLPGRLLTLLQDDPDPSVRIQAAEGLERFVYLAEVSDVGLPWKQPLFDALLAASRSSETNLALKALEALGHSSDAAVPDLIAEAYAAADDTSVVSALVAMGRTGDNRWGSRILAELRHPSPLRRAEAARAAGELELRKSLDDVIELVHDVHTQVQLAALKSLAQIGGKRAERTLAKVARRREDADLAAAAEEALELLAFVEETRRFEASLGLSEGPD